MLEALMFSLSGLPAFAAYFGLAALLLALFARIYSWITPHDEMELIRANNAAAAVAFGGAMVGFALPLASAVKGAVSLPDMALWGLVALLVQLSLFWILQWIKGLSERITQGEIAAGIFAAALAIAVGLLNAAAMSY